jgi:ankyrin repeat protein
MIQKTTFVLMVNLLFFSNSFFGMEQLTQKQSLNSIDIFICITSQCQPHEKNNLMKTCRLLYHQLSAHKMDILLANPSTVSNADKEKSLFKYVRAGDEKMVFLLLDVAKINPNIKNILKMTPLQCAKEEKIQNLLRIYDAKDAKMPIINRLHEAVYNGDIEKVKVLLQSKYNSDMWLTNSVTALHIAANENNIEIVKLLLNANAQINKKNHKGESALFIAAQKGHFAITELLINHGAYEEMSKNNTSAFYISLKNGNPCCASQFITWGMHDNNACGNDKATPLHIASEYGYDDIVQSLIHSLKLDINEVNKCGETSLFIASKNGHNRVVELLINAKAKVDKENLNNCSSLQIAVQNKDIEIIRLLINAGANVDKENEKNESLLVLAIHNNDADTVKLLIEGGANIMPNQGVITFIPTPLCVAACHGNIKIAHLLLSAGANVNNEDRYFSDNSWMPLHKASLNGHLNMVELLLSAGADVNRKCTAPDNFEYTASEIAEFQKHQDIVILLDNHRICMSELIQNGARKAAEIALRLGYDSRILYNNMLNIKANKEKSFIGSISALLNRSITYYENKLFSLNHSSTDKSKNYEKHLELLDGLSLKDLCQVLSPLNNRANNHAQSMFEGWKKNLK